jgi:hypothetical protein
MAERFDLMCLDALEPKAIRHVIDDLTEPGEGVGERAVEIEDREFVGHV